MKRGHSSLYGAVFALSWQTGKVIDYAVLSKFCYKCKNHARVEELKSYGDEVSVLKEDCVGHVQKRMGRRLRDLKNVYKGRNLDDGLTLGGRDRLMDKRIDLFQKYYGKAIRSNKNDKEGMKTAIWSILYHSASSNDNPQHDYCPEGETSWCGWQ